MGRLVLTAGLAAGSWPADALLVDGIMMGSAAWLMAGIAAGSLVACVGSGRAHSRPLIAAASPADRVMLAGVSVHIWPDAAVSGRQRFRVPLCTVCPPDTALMGGAAAG